MRCNILSMLMLLTVVAFERNVGNARGFPSLCTNRSRLSTQQMSVVSKLLHRFERCEDICVSILELNVFQTNSVAIYVGSFASNSSSIAGNVVLLCVMLE